MSHDPILARVRSVQLRREAANPLLNVHFIRETDGRADVYCFATIDQADRFRAKLERTGTTILHGRTMAEYIEESGE